MSRLSITDARRVCEKVGARQVVIVAFTDTDPAIAFRVVSYGDTKAECAAVRPLCDAIADRLIDGSLPFPMTPRA